MVASVRTVIESQDAYFKDISRIKEEKKKQKRDNHDLNFTTQKSNTADKLKILEMKNLKLLDTIDSLTHLNNEKERKNELLRESITALQITNKEQLERIVKLESYSLTSDYSATG